jgi:hypothetical protein
MEKLGTLANLFVEDVNKDDSVILEAFGRIVNFLFNTFSLAGIPFFLYVLLQFATLV